MQRTHHQLTFPAFIFSTLLSVLNIAQSDPQQHQFEITKSDGIIIATSSGDPKYTGELFSYEKVLTLNQDPSNDDSILFRPHPFPIGPDDYFYVPDEGNHRIAVFSPDGNFVRSFGRQGAGPGEFGALRLQSNLGNIIEFFDLRHLRSSRFRTNCTLIEVLTYPSAGFHLRGVHRATDDRRIVITQHESTDEEYGWSWRRVTIIEGFADTIATIESEHVPVGIMGQIERSGRSLSIIKMMSYVGEPVVLYRTDLSILISTGLKPELNWYNLDGKLHYVMRLVMEPVRVTREERQAILDAANKRVRESSGDQLTQALEGRRILQIPETKPFWTDIKIDEYGYIWMKLSETESQRRTEGGPAFRLLSPSGEYLGVTRWPVLDGMISRGHLTAIERDPETDEPFATVYQLQIVAKGMRFP